MPGLVNGGSTIRKTDNSPALFEFTFCLKICQVVRTMKKKKNSDSAGWGHCFM